MSEANKSYIRLQLMHGLIQKVDSRRSVRGGSYRRTRCCVFSGDETRRDRSMRCHFALCVVGCSQQSSYDY